MMHRASVDIRHSFDVPADLAPDRDAAGAVLLLREMTHRINNEFASLIGLMQRASRDLADAKAKAACEGMIECLYSHAEVHHALAMPERDELIDAAGYLGGLCNAISRSRLAQRGITLTLVADRQYATAAQCWMLGMIVSELITNSARHAFAESGGDIRVVLASADGQMQCRVSDNGTRCAGLQPSTRRSGLKIIAALAAAMAGTVDQRLTVRGARTTVRFPAARNCPPMPPIDCLNPSKGEFERCPANISGAAR
ncbi:MAG TPA: histidine kinase dimerization/phosphoacceptor domain -containing protein [Pseudolabrys sp.]|jgi:two-component sensor histidine kinase|nr:histidine kinase dimerization/phosphoacceptor domain -containing protein [Pseudolabrys sp.]